jgi:hypothetical protein
MPNEVKAKVRSSALFGIKHALQLLRLKDKNSLMLTSQNKTVVLTTFMEESAHGINQVKMASLIVASKLF